MNEGTAVTAAAGVAAGTGGDVVGVVVVVVGARASTAVFGQVP